MSVQAGIWNFDGKPVNRGYLDRVSQSVGEYGPDGETIYVNDPIGVLYRPFHTTLESRAERQPYLCPSGKVITWNGRLDNRDELIPELYRTLTDDQTDVAIVAAAMERWGNDCFRRLIGDWALSVWNSSERTLILARDYAGIQHLYYHPTETRVVWCTHLAPIVLLSGTSFTLNDEYIAGYLAIYPEAHLTPYREIQAVPPGHHVTIRNGKTAVHRYWVFNSTARIRYKTDREYEQHLNQLFRQAVRRRLRSDSPILGELSGGLDSSSIVCMADDILAKEPSPTPRADTLTYCISNEPDCDDEYYVSKVEEKRGRAGFHIDVKEHSGPIPIGYLQSITAPGHIGTGLEAETLRFDVIKNGGYRVVLSGIGGDEFLGGVPDPRPQLADLLIQLRFVELTKQLVAWSLEKRLPLVQLLFEALTLLLPASLRSRIMKEAKVEPWIDASFSRRHAQSKLRLGPLSGFGFFLPSGKELARTFTVMTWQMAYTQPSLAGCVEIRYPYLDQNLVEFLVSIPAGQLLRPGERRSLMRRAFANFLPPEISARRTKATGSRRFMAALDEHWSELEKLLISPHSSQFGYIKRTQLRDALLATKAGTMPPHLLRLLRAVSLELWLRDAIGRGVITPRLRPHGSGDTNLAQSRVSTSG